MNNKKKKRKLKKRINKLENQMSYITDKVENIMPDGVPLLVLSKEEYMRVMGTLNTSKKDSNANVQSTGTQAAQTTT